MPLLIVSRLLEQETLLLIRLPSILTSHYPSMFHLVGEENIKISIRAYVDRIYNEEGNVVREFKKLDLLTIVKPYEYGDYYLDFTNYHVRFGVPVGYIVQIQLSSFRIESKNEIREIPIFPNEFKIEIVSRFEIPSAVISTIEREREALKQIGLDVEIIGLLQSFNLSSLAEDLLEGLTRFYVSDFQGAIKFFRKVVEGLRRYIESKDAVIEGMGDNRREILREFLTKGYHLMSNFGEHSGTHGFMPEALLSKEITVASCRYLISYLKSSSQKEITS